MTDMGDDLRELGRRLWPDDSALRPRAAAGQRRWVGVALTVATAAVMVAVLTVAVARHDRGTAPGAASSPHGRGSGMLAGLHMVDASAGWAWGPTLVTRTTDGAATLVDVTPAGIDGARRVLAEDFLDAEHAWILGGPASGPGNRTLYRTDDGGGHWSRVALDIDPASLTFVDAQHGWLETRHLAADHVTSQIVLMRTVDAGATWSTVYRTAQRQTVEPNGPKGTCGWSDPVFATPELGFAGLYCDDGDGPRIDVTRDGGSTWDRIQLPPLTDPPAGTVMGASASPLRLVSAREALVAAGECIGDGGSCRQIGALYRTTDAGLSWTATSARLVTPGVMAATDPEHAWAFVGTALLLTDDGGRTWRTAAPLPLELRGGFATSPRFQFLSPTLGYAISVVGRLGPTTTHVYRTTDGGNHFTEFTPKVEFAPAPDPPEGGLSTAAAIAAAQRSSGPSSTPVSVESVAAGPIRDLAPRIGPAVAAPGRWVWSVVLRGTFSAPSCGPLPTSGSPRACPSFSPSSSMQVIVDYVTGRFIFASIPAPSGG